MGADGVVNVTCGQDLDAIVNADDATIGTRFQLEGPCTYTVDTPVVLNDGDEIAGPVGTFIERGAAVDPQPTVDIVGSASVSNVIRAEGTVHLEWVKIVGGTGRYSADGSPMAGTGSGLAMGKASHTSSLYAVHITGSDATGISNARGTFDRMELDDTTNNPDFLGFTGAGLKATSEVEIRSSYVHDNQGNGLWCDEFCHDSASHPNGFWIHDNLVVNNGRAGIRFERVGDVPTAGEALIENNEVHGNSSDALKGGVDIRDAQNALVRNNVFGAMTVADASYPNNADHLAIRATDSGRSDRPDLWNVDTVDNVLNGETIKGCELPDEVVACSEDTAPPVLSLPADIAAEATGPNGAQVNYIASANDAVDGPVSVNCTPASGSTFPLGTTTVNCSASDAAGNTANGSFNVTVVGTTSPTVISTVPNANATGIDPTSNVRATFSEDMEASTINGQTFNLFKKGSTTKLSATVSYDSSTQTATLDPSNSLQRGVSYKAVVSTKATDLAGNPLDQNASLSGSQQMVWFFTVRK
jgi:hypothetical protein